MFGDEKNLKDSSKDSVKDRFSVAVPYAKSDSIFTPYPKLSKLITALYMVTDIMDKEEPIRLQLRTIGAEILSDIHSLSRTELHRKIQTLVSFIDISLAVSLMSEMNFNILKKEFNQLALAVGEAREIKDPARVSHTWLEEFLKPEPALENPQIHATKTFQNNTTNSTNFSGFSGVLKDSNSSKKQRRDEILEAIKQNGDSATIAEVKQRASGSLLSCGEKTLQRELISMVQEGLLSKTGEKRWSRYFISNKTLS